MALNQIVLKASLLTGLVMTGLVDEGAMARSTGIITEQNEIYDQELQVLATGPAAVDLIIESDEAITHRIVYFPRDSVDLTPEARLALLEIANEVMSLKDPSVSITSQDSDKLLAFERIEAVAKGLEKEGFSSARLFTWSEIDMLTAREL